MVCFCDIPLSRINDHVQFYGEFGLGLTRQWGLRNKLSPVLYLTPENPVASSILGLNEIFDEIPEEKHDKHKHVVRRLLSFIKPVEGRMVVDSKPVEKEFYQESEWRHVAGVDVGEGYLTAEEFRDHEALRSANDLTRQHHMLKFLPSDIRYIFVRSDSDIPSLMNFIQTELDYYPGADSKILMSRVTSLESLRVDW
jgi:hypothetical protein